MPQLPQFALSVWTSAHVALAPVPHTRRGEPHAAEQVPPEHCSPAAQAVPQLPQFEESVCVFTQAAPHRISEPGQVEGTHAPAMHDSPDAHARPQRPQLALFMRTSMQPAPQSICSAVQTSISRHMPLEQVSSLLHGSSHAPQCALSVWVSTQSPPHAVMPLGQVAASRPPVVPVSVCARNASMSPPPPPLSRSRPESRALEGPESREPLSRVLPSRSAGEDAHAPRTSATMPSAQRRRVACASDGVSKPNLEFMRWLPK